MKKRAIFLSCLAAVFLFLLGASGRRLKRNSDFRKSIAEVPEFCLSKVVDSLLFCSTQFTKDKPVVLMYVHPECDYCHAKAQQLSQKTIQVEGIQWAMVSYAERDNLKKFIETYHLDDIPSVEVLSDAEFSLYNRLKVAGIPSSYIYNRQHRLVAVKQGGTKLETIVQLANRE